MSDDDAAIPQELEDVDTKPVALAAKLLVVDDEPANLVAAEAALEPLGRAILTARSADEALAHLLEHELALALVDVHMPDLDGYELAHLIRSRERTAHLPIIFMTAHSHDEHSVLRAYELGAVDFLFRPVAPEVLRAKVSVFVRLREQAEQLAAERMERDFENRRRDYVTAALRRERDRELAANKELARLNEALAEDDRRKDSFIAILAHELRNPLAPLRTCIDLIHANPDEPLTPHMVEVLERQTSVLVRLVADLLDISRIKADKIELRPEHADLRAIVQAAIAMSRPLVDERGHTLVVEPAPERVMIAGDTVRLGQVVCNLLNNAARYTRPGGRIELAFGGDDRFASLRVRDNGMGIPAELQDSIFRMFVQERVRSDGSGGLGLGLALSRRLVEMHGGTISVHSDGPQRGSTFEIRVPRAGSPHALEVRASTGDLAPVEGPTFERAVRTIVIDDNDDARELLSELLRSRGFEVLTAGDGPSGVALIREHRPDVALVDLGLPRLDGFGVVEELRRECPDLQTRLIALTGYGHADDYERTKRAGFHAHLVKPASAAAIFACVSRQLDPRA